jgi:iron complex outermembrane receptor protein
MKSFLLCLVVFLSCSLAAFAQSASIQGTVLDPSGAAVPNAKITLSAHGVKQGVTSNAAGFYQFSSLSGGTYVLTVEARGFGPYENSSIHVSAQGALEWNVRLGLQSASQSVNVEADAETLEQVPSVGKTGTMLQDLPQAVTVVGNELSTSQGDLELADTVRNAAGIIQGGSDGFGFADRFQIRGLEARIFNDGFSDGDEKNGLSHSLNGVERVEVLEGPGSSLFGSGPPGGTVNLVHFTPSPRFGFGAQYQAGSFGLNSGSLFLTGPTGLHGWNYRVDSLLQHKDGFRALTAGDHEVRPVAGLTTAHNALLIAVDGRDLQAVPDPAGLIYLNHTPITTVPVTTKYSTPFGYGNQAVGRTTASDVWQAKQYMTFTNRFSYMYRHLSILRNGDGGSIVGTALTGRQLRMQHDITNDFDFESEPVWSFTTGHVRHTLLTGTEIQHQSIGTNRATADLQPITNIFAPVIPETSIAGLTFLRDAKHSGAIDHLGAAYESLYATDQIDLTSRWKLRVDGRQDW